MCTDAEILHVTSFQPILPLPKRGLEEVLGSEQDTMFASRASSCMLGATLKDEAPEEEEVGLGRDGQVCRTRTGAHRMKTVLSGCKGGNYT